MQVLPSHLHCRWSLKGTQLASAMEFQAHAQFRPATSRCPMWQPLGAHFARSTLMLSKWQECLGRRHWGLFTVPPWMSRIWPTLQIPPHSVRQTTIWVSSVHQVDSATRPRWAWTAASTFVAIVVTLPRPELFQRSAVSLYGAAVLSVPSAGTILWQTTSAIDLTVYNQFSHTSFLSLPIPSEKEPNQLFQII